MKKELTPVAPLTATSAESFETFLSSEQDPRNLYAIMISAIVPRPIAWISTCNQNGQTNLAPFSFFCGVSSKPPCLAVSFTRNNDATKKHTLLNIEATGEFVVNTSQRSMVELINQSSGNYPQEISEIEALKLPTIPSTKVRPPRIAQSLVQFECKLYQKLEIGEPVVGAATLVIGEIVAIHVHRDILLRKESGRLQSPAIDFEKLQAISRLGGLNWGFPPDFFELRRPT